MNVLFFPNTFRPDEEEFRRLGLWQHKLNDARTQLNYYHKEKSLSKGEILLSKQRYHNDFRNNWKIYDGFGVDISKKQSND